MNVPNKSTVSVWALIAIFIVILMVSCPKNAAKTEKLIKDAVSQKNDTW